MSIKSRLAKLERGRRDGRCPLCWGRDEVVHIFGPSVDAADYPDGELPEQDIPDDQLPPDALPCPACGWEPTVVVTVEVVVSNPEQVRQCAGEPHEDGPGG